jgi:hypothetical protein
MVTSRTGAGAGSAGLSITLRPENTQRIAEASVTLHALSAKSRWMPANSGAEADITRDFHLTSHIQTAPSLTADVWLERKATVVWMEVTELRYADGSTWHAGPRARCRVVPDGVVLVTDTH